jgi:carbonic anhydrase
MIILILTVAAVISSTVQGSLQITEHEYTLMHFTKHISVEHFTTGRPLVMLLPLAEEDTTNKEVGYLIDELHTSVR